MAKFTVTRDYRCVYDSPRGGRQQVALTAGSTVDLDDDLAAFVSRDSPGTLEPPKPKPAKPASSSRPRKSSKG